MATSSKGNIYYNSSSGNIDVDWEATCMQFGSDEYANLPIDYRGSNTNEANNRGGDCATLTVEDRDPHSYEYVQEPYMNVNLGESPNEEKDTKPGERKVRTTMTRSPRKWMYIGVLTAVIVLLVISVSIMIVFLMVSPRSEENLEGSGSCPQYTYIENGRTVNTTGSKHGDVIEIECDEGYKLKGTNIITCTASGVWDGLPTCEMVSCGVPRIPTHASASDITGTSFKATATFKCDEGFYLDGNSVIRCQANGLWTKDSTCKGCPPGWKSFKGSCYLFSAKYRGWEDAKAFCESQKALLSKVDDSEEDDYIRSVISVQQYETFFWVGGRFDVNNNDFRWTDGTALTFNGWAFNKPRNNTRGCIDYLKNGHPPWRWNNHFDCVDTEGPSICEINFTV